MNEAAHTPIVRVEPLGAALEVFDGESIMAAAHRLGYYWPTICGGEGSCHTCYLRVLSGGENLTAEEPYEREGLEELRRAARSGDELRLACQARAVGDAVVHKRGVRAATLATRDAGQLDV